MNEGDRLTELIRVSLMKHVGKSCSLAENIAADLIASGVTIMPEWISVKERLPEKPMRCLVYTKRGKYGGCGVVHYNQGFYGDEYGTITHWMPFEPPKEENNNA